MIADLRPTFRHFPGQRYIGASGGLGLVYNVLLVFPFSNFECHEWSMDVKYRLSIVLPNSTTENILIENVYGVDE